MSDKKTASGPGKPSGGEQGGSNVLPHFSTNEPVTQDTYIRRKLANLEAWLAPEWLTLETLPTSGGVWGLASLGWAGEGGAVYEVVTLGETREDRDEALLHALEQLEGQIERIFERGLQATVGAGVGVVRDGDK